MNETTIAKVAEQALEDGLTASEIAALIIEAYLQSDEYQQREAVHVGYDAGYQAASLKHSLEMERELAECESILEQIRKLNKGFVSSDQIYQQGMIAGLKKALASVTERGGSK